MKYFNLTLLTLVAGCGWLQGAGAFEYGKEREWEFLDQAKFRGTMVGMADGQVQIRMADGVIRDFWPGGAEAISATYLQRSVTRLPTNPTQPKLRPGSGPMIDLTATALPLGLLQQWKNGGRAGGSFTALNQPPKVAQVQGRKAVVFEHAPWLLPLEFQSMVSDFIMPDSVTRSDSITLVAWLCNLGAVVDRETFFCWGEKDCGELDTPDFSYGCYEAMQWYDDKLAIPPARFPKFGQWHQFAYVISPSDKDRNRLRMDLYIDGTKVTGKLMRKPKPQLLANNLAFIGCAWEAWWGHSWETRPARPFTGAIAGLQVYDRALDLAEIRKLNGGTMPAENPVSLVSSQPDPADGASEIQPTLERLHWTPQPDAVAQVLHFGTDRDAVAKGTATQVKLKSLTEDAFVLLDLKLPKLECATTYYWRIEPVLEGEHAPTAAPWSFTTSGFALEFDGRVAESFPTEVQQDGFYNRWMDAGGYPIISPPGNEDIHMRATVHALRKLLGKRPDLVKTLQASNAATHLASKEHRGWGWSHFVCSSYGEGDAILREGAILMHEMGHQFQMQGAEMLDADFRDRLASVFRAGRHERLWMGDYGGRNMWENVAVCASWWLNDMTQDEGDIRPRELLRRSDPRVYHLLADYWPGDEMIELDPAAGVKTDAAGNLLEWRNHAGIEYFRPNTGWRFYQRTVGSFTPSAGKPMLRTVGGVSAMAFAGTDTLAWDQSTWDSLDGNRSWSVDAWVRRDTPPTAAETLVEWGTSGAATSKLLWGGTNESCQFPGGVTGKWKLTPDPQRWHHLVWVFTGGGVSDGNGELRVYQDGKLDHSVRTKLALPTEARIAVGRGFTGALAHLRIYNYDLHPLQVEALFDRELPAYRRPQSPAAGNLLVDLDPSILAPVSDLDSQPFYPAGLNQPWLRSWENLGTLGGKLHNDARVAGTSQPRAGVAQGVPVISFDGKSRMISTFNGLPASATVEIWAFSEKGAPEGTLLQWGPLAVSSRLLQPGAWQQIALTLDRGNLTAFLNGTQVSTAKLTGAPTAADRLILGAGGDAANPSKGFSGHVACLRIRDLVLTSDQLQQQLRESPMRRAVLPDPAMDGQTVVSRKPALAWQCAVGITGKQGDIYLGTRADEVANAKAGSPCHLGSHASGEYRPPLQPATDYFWRVDMPGTDGKVAAQGTVWRFRTAAGAVIVLDAVDLAKGPVKSWRNKGSAGGGFVPGTEREVWRPTVIKRDGLNGVDFGGGKSLISSFVAGTELTGSKSFTVAVWGYCPDQRVLEREQTMLSWGRRSRDHAEFGWGSSDKNGAFNGGSKMEFGFSSPGNAPPPGAWRHLAYVYDATADKLRIYVDGRLNREETVKLNIPAGEAICLGGVRTGKLPDAPFGGMLADVAIAGAALDAAQIGRLAQGTPADKMPVPWLVRLTGNDLPEGPLERWPNKGKLGGTFELEKETPGAPIEETVAGRAAVTFDPGKGFLCSTTPTPPALVGDRPFTVEMWLLNPKLTELETVFSLAPTVAMQAFPSDSVGRSAHFNFGSARDGGRDLRAGFFSSGPQARNVGWRDAPTVTPEWHHVAWVNSGGYRGNFKVYLDGKLVAERGFFTLNTIGGWPMHLGSAWNTARGSSNSFSGSLASLQVYDYIRTESEIQASVSSK